MSIRGLLAIVSMAVVLMVGVPARAHDGGSTTSQGDGTYTWYAAADLAPPAEGATLVGGPLNVTVSSNSFHKVYVQGPSNAGFSVTYDMWVSNDYSAVGSGRTATNLPLNLSGLGYWEQEAQRSAIANNVSVGSHIAQAFSSVTVAGAFNYAAVGHPHDYAVN